MHEERRQILGMLADNTITALQAERLLAALDEAPGPDAAGPKRKPKYLRVLVEAKDAHNPQGVRVNVRAPMQLLRAGVRLGSLIPPRAWEEANKAMRENGVGLDLSQLRPENLDELIDQLDELTVDVDQDSTRVRVFCE
ncbi:MAG: hypothetical protein JWM33_1930 [Caulobacteraceae bacterium]|nr:hypothetical protein [Caulobacteraceae bacterium]